MSANPYKVRAARTVVACLAVLLCESVAAQDAALAERHALDRFRKLNARMQIDVAHSARVLILEDRNADVQRIVSFAGDASFYPVVEPRRSFDPSFSPRATVPTHEVVGERAAAHHRLRQEFPELASLPDLNKGVFYDWATGSIARRETPLTAQEQFENMLRGYPPGADVAIARILALLDTDAGQRSVGEFLGCLYTDRDGKVYEGVTLYDVWASGKRANLPLADAQAFHVRVKLQRKKVDLKANDPAMQRDLRKLAAQYRAYRQFLEATAVTFVAPSPAVDDPYGLMVGRSHYLWASYEDEPQALATKFEIATNHDALLARLDREMRDRPVAFTRREQRFARMTDMAQRVKAMAVSALP